MTDHITTTRALLEQALKAFESGLTMPKWSGIVADIRAALAAPNDVAEEMSAVADQYAHKLALDLECVLADYSGTWYDTAMTTLGAYREAMNAIHERESPTFMGEPLLPDVAHRGMTTSPTLHDAPEVADLKAQRDELLALLIYASSEIKSEYPESQWSEYRVFEMEAAIAKAEGGAA